MRTPRIIEVVSAVIVLLGMLRVARAEPLLVSLEGQGAVALSKPQSDRFGPGASAALGLRFALGAVLQLGAEVRAGLLSGKTSALENGQADPGVGSFELGMLMLRLKPFATIDGSAPRRAVGFFLEVGAGGGVTGKLGRAGFQGGLGYGIGLGGGFSLAPTVRYLQIVQPSDVVSSRDARLLLFGLELTAFDARAHAHHALPESEPMPVPVEPPVEPPVAVSQLQPIAAPPSPEPERPDPESDRDHDHILDANDKCPDAPETVNGNDDEDGCPDAGLIVLNDDRIVLDAQVLFDAGFARIKHAGRPALAAIVALKKQHPEWVQIRIEGHADATGPEKMNQDLSERRAKNAKKYLIELGVPAEQIEAVGFGSSRPRDSGQGKEANQRNRRVEFVVVRGASTENER